MAPELTRVLLSADGRLKANYSDNRVLLLNASGTAFISCSSGDNSRQISACALARHAPLLAVALEFRNMHMDQPYICSATQQHSSTCPVPGLSLGYQLREVFWPASAEHAQAAGLVQSLPDAGIVLSASDSSARMVLHASQQRFAVCYPLLLHQDPSNGQFVYAWHTQVFSLQDHPSRWHPAVQVLLQVADLLNISQSQHHHQESSNNNCSQHQPTNPQHSEQHSLESNSSQQQRSQASINVSPLHLQLALAHPPSSPDATPSAYSQGQGQPPRPAATKHDTSPQHAQQGQTPCPATATHQIQLEYHSPPQHAQPDQCNQHTQYAQHNQQQPVVATELPVAAPHGRSSVCEGFPPGSWWFEPTISLLPSDELILLEWTPEAMYQFLPAVGEVQVWVHASSSCLVTQRHGRFVCHIRPPSNGAAGPPSDSLYAASAVPEMVWSSSSNPGEHQAGKSGAPARTRYPLATLAAHATKFREQMCAVLATQASAAQRAAHPRQDSAKGLQDALLDSFGVQCDTEVDSTELPGQGHFTAYIDGRVRAAFLDRTIMHLNGVHTHCKVFLPDGTHLVVAAGNPVGVEAHMQVLLKYMRWAFMSVEQRSHAARMQLLAQTHAAASGRMVKLLDYKMSHQLPVCAQGDTRDQSSPTPACALHHQQPESPNAAHNQHQMDVWPGSGAMGTAAMVEELLQRNAALLRKLS